MLVSYSYKFHERESNKIDFRRIADENGQPPYFVVTVENDDKADDAALFVRNDVLMRFRATDDVYVARQPFCQTWGVSGVETLDFCGGLRFAYRSGISCVGYHCVIVNSEFLGDTLAELGRALEFERKNAVKVHLPNLVHKGDWPGYKTPGK